MRDPELVALATRFTPFGAIAIRDFGATLSSLPEQARTYLLRCYAATLDVASGDAAREIALLRDALCKLRDCWEDLEVYRGLLKEACEYLPDEGGTYAVLLRDKIEEAIDD